MNTFSDSLYTAMALVFSFDHGFWSVVGRSLAVSATATVLAASIGLPLGAWLGVQRFRGRAVLVTLLNTALAVPSVVVGLVVYLLLSRSGPLGFLGWLFSFKAMVIAQAVLIAPLAVALSRDWVESAERQHGEQWQSLGAGPAARALLLAWDERHGLLTVVLTVFGRAIAEVGAVMIVGGNIDGFTRVMTTAIALETSKGDLPLALGLGLVLLLMVWALNGLLALLRWQQHRVDRLDGAASEHRDPDVSAAEALMCGGETDGAGHRAGGVLEPVWTLHGVEVRHADREVPVLHDIHLRIAPGERVALVGFNGSGKSTLLRTLHGLLPICAGQQQRAPGQRQAMLFQHPRLMRCSVLTNIRIAMCLQGHPWRQTRALAAQALQAAGFVDLAHRRASTLSGGQQQRVALLRARTTAPTVWLLDEPTSSLDPHARLAVEDSIRACAARPGATLVFSSHQMGQVRRLATRVCYLEAGRLVVDLPVEQFFNPAVLAQHSATALAFIQGDL